MDSGGLGDFLQQIPTGLVIMFCGSGLLLLITLGYIFNMRSRRARAAVPPAVDAARVYDDGGGDLPDLDALASTEAVPSAPPRPAGTFSVALAEGERVDVVEVLSVVRDVGDGSLIIRIGDKAYRNPPAVADAEFKRRFHSTLRDLNTAQRPVEAQPAAEVVEADEAESELPYSEPPAASAAPKTASSEIPRFSASEPAPGDLPKFKLPEGPPVKPKRGQRPVAEPIPEINIAGAIEAFLQHKLMQMPEYISRGIHVRSAPHGGVQIEVDGVFYESVGEVEDVAVRQLLTATIEEWQSRQ